MDKVVGLELSAWSYWNKMLVQCPSTRPKSATLISLLAEISVQDRFIQKGQSSH
jgi:hypothetical protein